ncbi:MAG: M56 family metallopeptidase [Prevotellaceae bacterium]|jgi:TonB family protein|nr:M56 family metallopeptidase [Prevotellaceae bacterium]
MGHFLSYIIQSSVCLALFYLFYRVLLSGETFHRLNRWALLGILLLSALLPLLKVTSAEPTEVGRLMLTVEEWWALPSIATTDTRTEADTTSAWAAWLLVGYLAGVAFLLVRFSWSFYSLLQICRRGARRRVCESDTPSGRTMREATLVMLNEAVAPFSWWHYIVVSRQDLQENRQAILAHEWAHLHARHSLDILAADICILLQWFNPAAWLLKQELQNTHEYAADRYVINKGIDATQYQFLLIKKAVGTRLYSMTNSFNHSKLKKRITMMKKEKSSKWAGLKYLYVLPLAAVVIALFARPQVSHAMAELSAAKVNAILPTAQSEAAYVVSSDTIYDTVDEMPSYPRGLRNLRHYIAENIKYPADALKAKIQGRVIVGFTIDRDGSVVDTRIMKSVHPDLDKEALRLVSEMDKWNPGKLRGKPVKVRYFIPIVFQLERKIGSSLPEKTQTILLYKKDGDPEKPDTIILNGNDKISILRGNDNTSSPYYDLSKVKDSSPIR